jgi:hypothetical protein
MLATLAHLGIKTACAGRSLEEATTPALLDIRRKGRVLIFSFASPTRGVAQSWPPPRAAGHQFSERAFGGQHRGDCPADHARAPSRRRGPRLHPLGIKLGLQNSERSAAICSFAHRRRRRIHHTWTFFPPREGHRRLPRSADPLRLRRFLERLRGHPRLRPAGEHPKDLPHACSRPFVLAILYER